MATAQIGEVNREAFLKRNQESQARRTGGEFTEWFKTPPGTQTDFKRYTVRLMPPHKNMEDVFVETKMHFLPSKDVGADGRPIPIGIGCLAVYGEDCGACKLVDGLFREARAEDDPDEAKRLKSVASGKSAKLRFFAQIVDMANPGKGVQKYAFGPEVEKKLRSAFFDDAGEFRNITHPTTGRNAIIMVGKKAGDFTTYDGTRASESVSAIKDMEWLDAVEDLNVLVVKPTVEEMALALRGERPKRDEKKTPDVVKRATEKGTERTVEKKTEKVTDKADKTEKAKPKRQAVSEDDDVDPYAKARAEIKRLKPDLEPHPQTPEGLALIKKLPPCFEQSTNVNDDMCVSCRVLIPCSAALLARGEEIIGPVDEE